MRLLLRLCALVWLITICACSSQTAAPGTGTLRGQVSVGPLSPVEQVDPNGGTPTPVPPEIYTSRSVNIYQEDGTTLVKNVPFNGDGSYSVDLPPGTYVVALPQEGIEFSKELPQAVTIETGKTIELNFEIDTGIR